MSVADIAGALGITRGFIIYWLPLTEQILPRTPVRRGFTAVEWGGAQIK